MWVNVGVESEFEIENMQFLPPDPKMKKNTLFSMKNTKVAYSIFLMVFLAEWGDKSQVATVAMGAARDFARARPGPYKPLGFPQHTNRPMAKLKTICATK